MAFFVGAANAAVHKVPYETGRKNAGTPYSTVVKISGGIVTVYGNGAIIYKFPVPPKGTSVTKFEALGQALFQQSCASCHGVYADGNPAVGTPGSYPSLIGDSPASVDFWIQTGRMPAANPRNIEAIRKQQRLTPAMAHAIALWITTLSANPAYPYIPTVNLKNAYVGDGQALFALNCAACHTITGNGDAIDFGQFAPSIRHVQAQQIAEAIRTGPGAMPRFSGNLTDAQVRDIVAYVSEYIDHPRDPGGFGLGGLGPVAEGFIGLAIGVGILALAGFWIGERQ